MALTIQIKSKINLCSDIWRKQLRGAFGDD